MPDYPLGKWGYSPGARNLRGVPSGQICMWCVVTYTCTGNHKYNYRSMHVPPCCRPAWNYLITEIVIMNRTSKKKSSDGRGGGPSKITSPGSRVQGPSDP